MLPRRCASSQSACWGDPDLRWLLLPAAYGALPSPLLARGMLNSMEVHEVHASEGRKAAVEASDPLLPSTGASGLMTKIRL